MRGGSGRGEDEERKKRWGRRNRREKDERRRGKDEESRKKWRRRKRRKR